MTVPYFLALFVFGLLIGSFLNVVILRFNTGMRISKGRSACFSCNKTLVWYELVPLFSFIFQRGRCGGCESKISLQYPLVELAGGLIFPLAFYIDSTCSILTAALLCVYIVICVYDLRHKIIPDLFSYIAAGLALAGIALDWWTTGIFDLSRFAAGPALFFFFFFFWFVSRGRWMGLGDAKLALSVGWFLGFSSGIAALLLSFWIGALVSLILIAVQKIMRKGSLGMKSEIPFGPFILLGFLIAFVFHIDLAALLSHLAV